jgi:hypothetical protein
LKIVYFAHDLNDAAVKRRARMLQNGGAQPVVFGFHRQAKAPSHLDGMRAHDLGRTTSGPLKRLPRVALAAISLDRWREAIEGAEVIMGRTLEMLALAAIARKRFAPSARLVYECLDIHRMMLRGDPLGRTLRMVEDRLLRQSDLLIASSPAFITEYFAKRHAHLPPVCLIENKPLAAELRPAAISRPTAGPPWRIGWFGVIRCRRSLAILAAICRAAPGLIALEIRGRPAYDVLPDFDATVGEIPDMSFLGGYDHQELANLYGSVHFTWTIDYFEQQGNSNWLLPNRLYEGSLYGSVPIALATTETARWLQAQDVGAMLPEPLDASLQHYLQSLTERDYEHNRNKIVQLRRSLLVCSDAECRNFIELLRQIGKGSSLANGPTIADIAEPLKDASGRRL